MWLDKEISISGKKHNAKVNCSNNHIEIELPHYDGWDNLGQVQIDDKSYIISSAENVGGRDELIKLITKGESNESKSDKSRKKSGVQK
jgi:hypothetical protein|tara:strand:- start:86 stop:349 length:264 start_codon:yes stop_codon:yes gene_type:complete